MPLSRASARPRDRTCILTSCALASWLFTASTTREARPKKRSLFLLITTLTKYSTQGSHSASRVRQAPTLLVHPGSSRSASKAREPKLLVPEVLGRLDTRACHNAVLFALRDSAQLMPQPPPHQQPLLSHTHWRGPLLTLQPGPHAPCSLTPGSSPPGMSPFGVHLPSHSTARASPPTQWPCVTLGRVQECATLLFLGPRSAHRMALWGCCSSSPSLALVISGGVFSLHRKLC